MIGSSPFPQPIGSPFAKPPVQRQVQKTPQPKEATMPRFVNYLADYSGCGHWRIIWPENVINMTQRGISQKYYCYGR